MFPTKNAKEFLSFEVLENLEGCYVLDLQEFSQTAPILCLQTLLNIYRPR